MRGAPYLVVILGLIAFQMAFGLYVKGATGSHLTPVIYDSISGAFGLWTVAVSLAPIVALIGLDRERPVSSLIENLKGTAPNYVYALGALVLLSLSLAMMNWTKSMIPAFTADHMLADLDRVLFGTDPARLFLVPVLPSVLAFAYAAWMPLMFGALTFAAYTRNFLVVVSLVLTTAIDTVMQFTLPSAGPIFWERLGWGSRFDYLSDSPGNYQAVSSILWSHHQAGTLIVGSGISAFPSMHVALSAWMALSFPKARAFFVPFLIIIFAGSIASGWHYFSDGVAGCLMAYLAHRLATFREVESLSQNLA